MNEDYKNEKAALENLLLTAVRSNNTETAKFLLNKGIDSNIHDLDDKSLLYVATERSNLAIIEAILQHGGDIEFKFDGINPLILSIQTKSINITRTLLEYGAKPNVNARNQIPAIEVAKYFKNKNAEDLLMEYSTSEAPKESDDLFNLIKSTIKNKQTAKLKKLLNYNSNVDILSSIIKIPALLELAINTGNHIIVSLLLANGADAKATLKNTYPLHLAIENGFFMITNALIKAGANIEQELQNCTPLCLAIRKEYPLEIKLLTSHGAKVMYGNQNLLQNIYKTQNNQIIDAVLQGYLKELAELNTKQKITSSKDKFEVVIVRYSENLDWIKSEFPNEKVTIYNKGKDDLDLPSNCNIIKLDNIGYLGGTYLHHIKVNYNNLPDRTLFLQGYPYDTDLTEYPLNRYKSNYPTFNCKNIAAKCWGGSLTKEHIHLSQKDWESTKYHKFEYNELYSIIDFTHKYICKYPVNAPLSISYGAQFAVDRDNILSHSLEYYQNLSTQFNTAFPMVDHFFERTLSIIFGVCDEYS